MQNTLEKTCSFQGCFVVFEKKRKKSIKSCGNRAYLKYYSYFCGVMIKLNGDMKFFWYYGKQLIGLYKNPFV